jgi:hypothetical protein
MRILLGVGIFMLAMTAARDAGAAPYCATYSDGGVNCGFYSMWSCRAAVSGVGGSCSINTLEVPYVRYPRRGRAYRGAPPCRVYLGFGRWAECE